MSIIAPFSVPSRIRVGGGAISELSVEVLRFKATRALIVTDNFVSGTPFFCETCELLNDRGIETIIFDRVQPDPTLENVENGLQLFRDRQAQIIIAIGGGSSIDCGKAIASLANNAPPLAQYIGYHKILNRSIPLIAVPTTAGTGSEVTRATVITDSVNGVKMMILDDNLLPAAAIIDYELSLSMPQTLTANVGVDTLTHGIEAYVSRKAHALTDPIALSCIRLVSLYLKRAWSNPQDRVAREGMSIAACQGGMAFSNSSVCLVHGMSRPIGAIFHVPHGLSNAVLLPTVTRFSIRGAQKRYADVARTMNWAESQDSDESASLKLAEALECLNSELNIPRLGACKGVDINRFEENLDKMASDALDSGSPANNPVVPTASEIVSLYRAAI
jgi:alcohol dehydrogenase class IV